MSLDGRVNLQPPKSTERARQIPLALGNLDTCITQLEEEVRCLEDRLTSVLTSPKVEAQPERQKEPSDLCNYASNLKSMTSRILDLKYYIAGLAERLEV